MRRVAIVGCRPPKGPEWDTSECHRHFAAICESVKAFVQSVEREPIFGVELVSGGADGVDTIAHVEWRMFALGGAWIFKPDYATHGKSAPLVRNQKIVDMATEIHAWPAPWSRGTWHTVRLAREAGKPCTVHEIKL